MADPVAFTVGVQSHTSRYDANGQAVAGVNIPVKLATGEMFDVFVDNATYSDLAAVKAAIQDAVDHHVAIANYTGPGT